MIFFTEVEQVILKLLWTHERPRITKSMLKEKKKSWIPDHPRLQTILQSYSNKNNIVFAQKWT